MKFKYCIVLFCCFCLIACTDADDAAVADHPAYHNPTVQQLTDAIAENPNDAALYYKRSIALSRINQDSLSLIDLLKATSIDSTKPEYYQAIGFVQINLGNYAADSKIAIGRKENGCCPRMGNQGHECSSELFRGRVYARSN
jgi:hypothetical protein